MHENKAHNDEITREEIKKEFQLERMILFSDAVFAIVITLMAIEIHLPESAGPLNDATLPHALLHVVPVTLSYMVSFTFIGAIWYQHLKIFSLLKDYDLGLVLRNLLLLFCVGLFPFCASLMTKANGSMIATFIYLGIILLCIFVQFALQYYIVVQRPEIRLNAEMTEHVEELRKRKVSLVGFAISAVLIVITYLLIPDPNLKGLSMMWMMVFPLYYRLMYKKKKK